MDPKVVRPTIDYLEHNKMSLFANPPPIELTPETTNKLGKAATTPCFFLDTINSLPVHTYPLQKHVVIDPKKQPALDFRGWAIYFASRGPCSAVFLDIDNKLDIPAATGIPEREVARKHRRQSFL